MLHCHAYQKYLYFVVVCLVRLVKQRKVNYHNIRFLLMQIEVSTIISQAGATLSSLVSRAQDLVSKLKALQFDRHEFVCLKYLVLFNPGGNLLLKF